MSITEVEGVCISKIACALPKEKYSLAEFAPNLYTEKTAQRASDVTGFSTFRIAPDDMTTADLCFAAAEVILNETGRNNIGGLVFVTQTPNYVTPATSHALQHRLGLNDDVLCLDINEGCSGWVTGLYAAANLCNNMKKSVLLLCGDTSSKVTSPNDRATRSIFGDTAAATLVEPGDAVVPFTFRSYGEYYDTIFLANHFPNTNKEISEKDRFMRLDGGKILEFSLKEVPQTIKELLSERQIKTDDVTLYACHQANKLIINSLANKLDVPQEKVPFTAGKIGNESSASIPFVLTAVSGTADLTNTLCCGFGVGLSIGVCLADFSQIKFLGIKEVSAIL